MGNKGIDFSFSSTIYRSMNNDLSIRPYFNINYNSQKILGIYDGKQLIGEGRNYAYALRNEPIYYALPMFKGVNPDNGKPEPAIYLVITKWKHKPMTAKLPILLRNRLYKYR